KDLVRVDGPLGELVADANGCAVLDLQMLTPWDLVNDLVLAVLGRNLELASFVAFDDLDRPAELRDLCLALRLARFEQLDHARQTVRDVFACDATGVERTHRQLGARLTDRLRRDDADRFADFDEAPGRKIAPIAANTNADLRIARQHGSN